MGKIFLIIVYLILLFKKEIHLYNYFFNGKIILCFIYIKTDTNINKGINPIYMFLSQISASILNSST